MSITSSTKVELSLNADYAAGVMLQETVPYLIARIPAGTDGLELENQVYNPINLHIGKNPWISGNFCPKRTALHLLSLFLHGRISAKHSVTPLLSEIRDKHLGELVILIVQGELLRRKDPSYAHKELVKLCSEQDTFGHYSVNEMAKVVSAAKLCAPYKTLSGPHPGHILQAPDSLEVPKEGVVVVTPKNLFDKPVPEGTTVRFVLHRDQDGRINNQTKEITMSKAFEVIPHIFGVNAATLSNDQLIEAAQKCKGLRDSLKGEAKDSTKVQAMREELKAARIEILAILDARS